MSNFIQKIKKHYLLLSFIILYVIIPILLSLVSYLCAHSLEFFSENVITIVSGVLAYIGTTTLGLVSVWQNRQSVKVNERLMRLQCSEFKKNKSSIIRIKETINFEKYKISNDFFDKCKEIPQSFFVLESQNFNKNSSDKFLRVDFFFDSIGHELNEIGIQRLTIRTDKNKIIFKPSQTKPNTGYTFEFEEQAFKLSLLLFDNDLLHQFDKMVLSNTLLFEIDTLLVSKASISSSLFLSLNLKDYKDSHKIKNCLYFYNKDSLDNPNI